MGGCSYEDDCEFISPRTVVLVGKTGNGKSATGNSLLGMKCLLSKRSSSGVTITSELKATTLGDGQMLNVIDTPGLFDPSLAVEFIGKEIVKCISMAQDGVDAFLVVVSTFSRFSEEERAALSGLQTLFGRKIYDYMILVFTGGDELEDDNQNLEEFLCGSPESLKEIISLCGNRYVLFDNKTKDETKRSNQVKELLFLVNLVSTTNDGKPYTNEIFSEIKNQTKELKEQEMSVDDERFKHIYHLIESKFKETTLKLEQQLAEKREAHVKAEKKAKSDQKKLHENIRELKEKLENAGWKNKEPLLQKGEELQRKKEQVACVKTEKKAETSKKKPVEVKELSQQQKEPAAKEVTNAKAAKTPDEEIKMLKEKLQKAEKKYKELKKQKDDELRGKEAHWRQREADLRKAWVGCYMM